LELGQVLDRRLARTGGHTVRAGNEGTAVSCRRTLQRAEKLRLRHRWRLRRSGIGIRIELRTFRLRAVEVTACKQRRERTLQRRAIRRDRRPRTQAIAEQRIKG